MSEERLAKNEVLFRDVNERIARIAGPQSAGDDDSQLYDFLCECSNMDCKLRLPMSLSAYEDVRRDPTRFVIAPGHDLPEIEEVVLRTDDYQVVSKEGGAGALAAREDPR